MQLLNAVSVAELLIKLKSYHIFIIYTIMCRVTPLQNEVLNKIEYKISTKDDSVVESNFEYYNM